MRAGDRQGLATVSLNFVCDVLFRGFVSLTVLGLRYL